MGVVITRPASGNPYYNGRPSGYSICIPGNYPKNAKKKTGYPGLDRLPNCVGYSVGFLNESNACEKFSMLGSYAASQLIEIAKQQGLEVTKQPTTGGIMVWAKTGGSGHCAVVKKIVSNTIVNTAESEYNGAVYSEYTRMLGDGNWRTGCYWMGSNYTYRGCIKNPAFEVENMTIDELIENITPEQAYKLEEKARNFAGKLPVSNFAKAACEKAVEVGAAADGDGDGSVDAPRASLLRQELFVILSRLGLLQ